MPDLLARGSDGARLAVTDHGDAGDGRATVLLIPGLGATRHVYAPLLPLLTPRLRVAAFDPRGTGASEVPQGPYSMRQLAEDCIGVLDALRVRQALVFGASMGGMVAQHVALDAPDRVAGLVLACTGCGGPHAVPAARDATRRLLGSGARTPEEAYRLACTVLYEPGFVTANPGFIEGEVAHRRDNPVPAQAFGWQFAAVRGHDTWARLPGVRIPTLVVHGTADAVMPLANGQLLQRRIPGAIGEWLYGRGHLFFHEAPERAAAAILAFTAGQGF